jgi:hypothetical protein
VFANWLPEDYLYLVYYTVDVAREEVVIVTIQHPAREREYEDA